MAKELWNKCKCGAITDIDEKCCPACGSNASHPVELDLEEIKTLIKEGKVYTKHIANLERRFPMKKPT